MPTWFDVIPDGNAWVVRCQAALYGRYHSQVQAFNAAVSEARKIHDQGRTAKVRILRDADARDLVTLL